MTTETNKDTHLLNSSNMSRNILNGDRVLHSKAMACNWGHIVFEGVLAEFFFEDAPIES
jgi:hypothetical protein